MSEIWLLSAFIAIFFVFLPFILYPLRKTKQAMVGLLPVVMGGLILGYSQWGAWGAWQEYLVIEKKKEQATLLFQSLKGPQDLIRRLYAHVQTVPDDAKGWYLLGRLYASQGEWALAKSSFAKAHRLKPQEIQITLNYAQSLWQLNHRRFTPPSRALYQSVLKQDAHHPDALAMAAMDAYANQNYTMAINYWQQLLQRLPPTAPEAQAIRQSIKAAYKRKV